MYYPYFITYMIVGIAITLPVLLWAIKNGQFSDQQRARYLPLEDDHAPLKTSRFNRLEIYGLMVLAGTGVLSSIAVLAFSLLR
jgi:nitrogen fixation-related uncharacterized protein